MVRREVVETCFIDVIRAVNKHDLSTDDQSFLAALLISGAIHSALEQAAGNGGIEGERSRLSALLTRLQAVVQEWAPENGDKKIADDLFTLTGRGG
jgi:hypothetical protein